MANPLLPVRHPEKDLFICDFGEVIPKSDIARFQIQIFVISDTLYSSFQIQIFVISDTLTCFYCSQHIVI
jgi:hypothetical protein